MHEEPVADELMPIGPAARRIERSPEWLRELCDRGRIPYLRDASGRRLIRASAIEEFLAARREAVHKMR